MDKIEISNLCISMAKDVLEISTHASRNDRKGIADQIRQLQEKVEELNILLEA